MAYDFLTEEEEARLADVQDIFAEAQRSGSESLGADFADRFCFSRQPNALTKARWLTRHKRPEPETEEQAEKRRRRAKQFSAPEPRTLPVFLDLTTGTLVIARPRRPPPKVKPVKCHNGRGRPQVEGSVLYRVVAQILATPGATITEVAEALGLNRRLVALRLNVARVSQRVFRVGPYGHGRYYPGPRAVKAAPEPIPEPMAKIAMTIEARALAALEAMANESGKALGEILTRLILDNAPLERAAE